MRILCFLLFFMCFPKGFAQTIRFEHIGECDKPMPVFYIQKGKKITYELNPSYTSMITTDPKTFEVLSSYVFESKPKAYNFLTEKGTAFGTYDITVINYDHNGLTYTLTIDQARVFVNGLLPLLKQHTEFYDDVEKLIKRLG